MAGNQHIKVEFFSRIVDHAELKKNDHSASPCRCIHTSDAETYRPIAELDAIEAEARETDKALKKILKQLGVLSQCKAAGLPEPDFAQDGDQFTVTLWRDALTPARLDQLGLNERQKKALGVLRMKPRLTNTDYQKLNAIARSTVKRDLEELVQLGLLELVGSGRGAHYRLTGKWSVPSPTCPDCGRGCCWSRGRRNRTPRKHWPVYWI